MSRAPAELSPAAPIRTHPVPGPANAAVPDTLDGSCVQEPPAVWLRQWKRYAAAVEGQSSAIHHQFVVSCVNVAVDPSPGVWLSSSWSLLSPPHCRSW